MSSMEQSQSSAFEMEHPVCPTCNVPMWMVEVSHHVSDGRRSNLQHYECKVCGGTAVVPQLSDPNA